MFEVATTGTVTSLGRRGKRLGTVYLAYTPEFGQQTMSKAFRSLMGDGAKTILLINDAY